MPTPMYHPELPGAEFLVVNDLAIPVHRQSGWLLAHEMPKDDKTKNVAAPRSNAVEEK